MVLEKPITAGGKLEASNSISLTPGFLFIATASEGLTLSINPNIASPMPSNETFFKTISEASNAPTTEIYTNALGREVRKSEMRFDGIYLNTDTQYDDKGRVAKTSTAYKRGSTPHWNSYMYDIYDRITALNYASGKKDTFTYNENSVTIVSDGMFTTKTYNALEEVTNVVDSAGNIVYNYRADGQLASIVAPGNVTTAFEYDVYGRKTAINDPSAGKKTYVYDLAGNISKETDADLREISMTYDIYNRLKTKTIDGTKSGTDRVTTTIAYNIDGLVSAVSESNGISKTYTYDAKFYDRIIKERENIIDDKWLEKSYSYISGILSSVAYKSSESNNANFAVENYRYTNGHLKEILLGTTSIWRLDAENSLGMAMQATTGSLTRTYGYDSYGIPTARVVKKGTSVIQDFGYNFDVQTGNLNWRKDNTRTAIAAESFGYDGLNRLTKFGNTTLTYDIKGNITDNTAVAKFEYNISNKPYQMTIASPYGNNIPLRNQSITYNAAMRPTSISENGYTTSLTYNSNGDRIKTLLKKGATEDLTRYYLGGQYEIDKGIAGNKERLYLGGDAYSAAAVYVKEGATWSIHYILRDYLGSITHITDAAGAVKQELSYDPWGRLRNPETHALYDTDNEPKLFLARGYTGHEHLPHYGLINMNARLYDPVVGRFLSPDPYVQAMFMSQNFNRYSYCLNNPLRYTDESGEFIIPLIAVVVVGAALIGGAINVAINWDNISSFGQGLAYFGVGAVAGGAGVFIGLSTAGFGLYSAAAGIGFFAGGANAWITQGYANGFNNFDWGNIRLSAATGAITSVATMGLAQAAKPLMDKLGGAIANKVLAQVATQATMGTGSGFVMGTGMGYAMTGDFGDALAMGGKGALWGFGTGTVTGFSSGVINNVSAGRHWFSGASRSRELVPYYPKNDGAVSGSTANEYLMPGQKIDRYGGDAGYYFSDIDTPLPMRSLPYDNSGQYNQYQVLKPIHVQKSVIAPWFGQPGGGIQYKTPVPVRVLESKGFIIKF